MTTVLALAGAGCASNSDPADLVLLGGNLVTLDPGRPRASALAARTGRIVAVGTDREISHLVGPRTRVMRLDGRLAVPGFIEGHAHFVSLGRSKLTLDLRSARRWDEVVARVAETAAGSPSGAWIVGRGWHQEKWEVPPVPSVRGYPTRDAIDRAAPRNPVYLQHASGHAALANRLAMRRAGIGPATDDPQGGEIVRDPRGVPTGLLLETAEEAVQRAYDADVAALPADERETIRRREIDAATEECLRNGITTFVDAGADFDTVDRLRRLAESGELGVRLWVMLGEPLDRLRDRLSAYRIVGAGDGRLTVRSVKRYMDGALGPRGAWMLEPYDDDPTSRGARVEPLPALEETARLCAREGFQLAVHAIGDRGVRETLDLYQRTFGDGPGLRDARWRIEHAQHIDPADIPRFAELGVIAAVQGIHCTSDAPWVPRRIGPRRAAEGAYPWRRLLDSGARVCNGTDAPVESVDPIACFAASVTRRARDGSTFHPDQRMTRIEALRSYTWDAAYATFEENVKGSLSVGKVADVVVLSRDILSVPEDEIAGSEVVATILGGRVVYPR